MDHRETERFMARMTELQPRVPAWCKAEQMEISLPQKDLWHYGAGNHSQVMKRIIHRIKGRQKQREASP